MVTDYDCWHPDHDSVSVENIIGVLLANAGHGRALVKEAARELGARTGACSEGCHTALNTPSSPRPMPATPAMAAKLEAVAGRVLGR